MKTRRYSLLTLALLLMVSVLNVRAQAPDAFYIYKNDGTTMPFFNDLVDSVKWSNYDLDGNYHRVAVVQEVYTTDSLYRIPLELIDSIGFHKPENKYTADAVRMEQQPWWEYVTEYIDTLNVILLRQDVPESIMPKVGDKLVTVVQNDIFPGGFMGKVVHIEPNPEDGQQVVICERLDFKDVFTEFTASAGFVAQDPATAAARAEAPQKRHIDIDKTIHWPKVDFLGGSWGLQVGATWDLGDDKSKTLGGGITFGYEPDYDIELWVHYSIETGLEYQYKHRGTVNLKRTYNIQGTGSYHKDLDFGHYKWAIPNCPLLWWYVEPGVFVDASVTISLNWFTQQKYHDYVFVSYKEYEPDLNVYTARTWDETPAESSSASYSLSGSLSAGFYTEIGLRLPPAPRLEDNDAKYLMGRIQLGARIEGSTEVDIKEAIVKAFTDASVYRWLNNEASFAVTAFLSGELKLQTPFGGNFFYSLPFEVTASLGTKFGIVPSFDNVDVTTGKLDSIYYAICKSDVARNLIIPARNMGFTVRDGKGKTVSRVGNRFYWFSSFENMTDTIRGLEPGINYSLHPSFDFLGVIPMLGYPNKDFTVGELELDIKPQPIVATRERNVLRLPILTNARRTGVEVVEGAGWLHAVTDSLTLLVRTDSLPGNQPRSGKLMLKATTSDDTNELQIEVYVNQGTDRMIELEPQSLDFLAVGGTKQVKVTLKEPDRTLSVTGQPEWLKITVSGTTINVTAEQNPDKNRTRTCTLIVLAEDKNGSRVERPLTVTQQCAQPALIVEPKEVVLDALPPTGSSWNIANMNVSILKPLINTYRAYRSEGDDWLKTGGSFARASEEGDYYVGTTMVYSDQPNTSTTEERSGVVTFSVKLADNSTVEEQVVVRQKPLEPVYNLSPGKITLMDKGDGVGDYSDYQQVTVETNLAGYFTLVKNAEITASEPWLLVNSPLGWRGPLTVYAYMNIEPDSRSGEVNIKLTLTNDEVIERTLYVTQKGTADSRKFSIDPVRLEFPGAGGEKALTIVPAQGVEIDRIWEVDCHTAGNSWLNGSGMNLKLIMTAEPNPSKGMRQRDFAVTVLLKDGTKVTENFIAYQKPAGIDLYPSQIEMSPFGGIEYANMETSAEPVTITTDVDWLTVTRSGNAIFVEADMWCGDQRRYGHVDLQATLDDGTVVKNSLFVNQQSTGGFFRTEPSKRTVEAEGGKEVFGGTIFVNNSYEQASQITDISLSSNVDWITPKRGGNSGFQLYYDIAANPTNKERQGEVFLTAKLNNGKEVTAHQLVTQKAGSAQPITLSLSPSSLNFTDAGGSGNVSVTTDANANNISVKASASWIHATRSGTTITVRADANTSTSSRSGSVTVTVSQDGQTATQTISVSQSGKSQGETTELPIDITGASIYFDLNPDYIEATNKEEFSGWDGYRGGPGLFSAAVPYNGYHSSSNVKRYSENLRAWMEGDYVIVEGEQHSGFVTSDVSDYMHDVTDRIHLKFKASNPADPTTYVLVDGTVNQKDWNTEWYGPDNYTAIVNYECTNTTSFNIKSNIPFSSGSYNSGFTYEVRGSTFNSNHLSNYEFDFNLVSHNHNISDRKYHISGVKIMNSSYNYMRVVLQAKELPKNYSGAFIGDWRSMDSSNPLTVNLGSDGSFYKKVGSQAAVTGSYTLISYSYDENSKTYTGKLREPDSRTVSFNGGYSGSGWSYVEWMVYDGVKVSTNFDM
ncbi:MAG: hypothetical protein II864_07810 [Prevotella sp.]|nr:hypothetical protein [Prevotella sp.]